MSEKGQKKIYVVLSHTGTIVAKLIKLFTRKEFSHASISLTEDLHWMYSFGRLNPYNPFWAGLVREAPDRGTFKRFYDTDVIVLELSVTSEELEGIRKTLGNMLAEQGKYHYNYIGLFKAGVKKPHRRSHYRFYCSEFVGDVLKRNNIAGSEKLPSIVHPINFLELPHSVVYRGKLREYAV